MITKALVFSTYELANAAQDSLYWRAQGEGTNYAVPQKKYIGSDYFFCVNADDYDVLTEEETAALVPIDNTFYKPLF